MIGSARRTLWALLLVSVSLGVGGGGMRLLGQVPDSLVTIRGRVLEHETGVPVRGATVSLATGPTGTPGIGTRVTGREGDFLFGEVPPGLYRLRVTGMSYVDLRDTLRVEAGSDLELTLPVSASPVPLEPIVVSTTRRRLGPMRGFERRRQSLFGTFITREEIEDRRPHRFTDLLRTVPGLRLVPARHLGYQALLRGGCQPVLVMDGLRIGGDPELDLFVQPADVEAVEVYHFPNVPAELGANACGAIVVWTRRGEPTGDQDSLWRRLLFVVGVFSLTILLTR